MSTGTYFTTRDQQALDQFSTFMKNAEQWRQDVKNFADKVGAKSSFGGIGHGKGVVQALEFAGDVPPSRWKSEGRGHAPYKNHPLRAEFEALTRTVLALDGIENGKIVETSRGHFLIAPDLFLHEGALFLTYSGHNVNIETSAWESISEATYTVAYGEFLKSQEAQSVGA